MSETILPPEVVVALENIKVEFGEIEALATLIAKADYSKVDVVALLRSLGESSHRAGDIALEVAERLTLKKRI